MSIKLYCSLLELRKQIIELHNQSVKGGTYTQEELSSLLTEIETQIKNYESRDKDAQRYCEDHRPNNAAAYN